MKISTIFGTLALAGILLLGGCASRYAVVTSDYSLHIATSKPEMEDSSDLMTFKDESGSKVTIPRKDIKQIRELKN